MKAIFASKLYIASSRKEHIQAALNNPANGQLVKQLKRYLDDEYLDETHPVEDSDSHDDMNSKDSDDGDIQPSEYTESRVNSIPSYHSSPSGGSSFSPNFDTDIPDPDEPGTSTAAPEISEDTPVEESTDIQEDVEAGLDSIKGLLDSRDDCTGVARVRVLDDEQEVWIHYNDSINLNNVMEPVIALLNSASYPQLQFNRLARTENAIVFSINKSSSDVEPVTSEE